MDISAAFRPNDAPDLFGGDFLARLLAIGSDCVKILDLEARLLFVSAGGLRALEAEDASALVGRCWTDLWSGEDRQRAEAAVAEALAGRAAEFEGACATLRGTPKRWVVRLAPLCGPDGRPDRLLAISRDVTGQHRAETEAREKAALLAVTLDNMDQGLMMAGSDGIVAVCNRRAVELLDLPTELMARKPHFLEVRRVQVAQGEYIGSDHAFQRWLETGELVPSRLTYERVRPNGVALEVRTVPLPDGGVVRTYADVTARRMAEEELKASEERYRALVAASAAIVWRAAPDGSIRDAWGWSEFSGQFRDEYKGHGWLAVVHPDDRAGVVARWRESVATGISNPSDYRVQCPGGDYRWVRGKAVPLRNPDGSIREWVGTLTDIHVRKETEEALQAGEERLRLAVEATGLGTYDLDMRTEERQWSPEMRAIVGIAPDAPIRPGLLAACIHPDDRDRVDALYRARLDPAQGGRYQAEYRIRRADTGAERWVAGSCRVLFDEHGVPVRTVGTLRDITERKRAEESLRAGEERLRLALGAGRMVAWELDPDTGFVTRSSNSHELLGLGSGPLSEYLDRVHPDDRARVETAAARSSRGELNAIEFRYLRPDGEMSWLEVRAVHLDEGAAARRVVGITFDITDRKHAEERAWRAANHDPLTGLPNRAYFQNRLKQALVEAGRGGGSVSLLLIDLDNFKDVNDTLGHDAGDALLKQVAERLRGAVRDVDTVARLGGDEFAIVLVDPLHLDDAARIARRIAEDMRRPFLHKSRTIASRASIGVAAFPDHDAEPAELLKDADVALYAAKAQGRNRAVVYSPAMRRAMENRVTVARDLREAIASGQIVPYYQPKVSLATGRIVGFEALARWLHPSHGLLTPGAFASAFEDAELAVAIGRCMTEQVAADLRRWLDLGLEVGRVAVNLSAPEFADPDLADRIASCLSGAGIAGDRFAVEVTESVFLGRDAGRVGTTLRRLHERGIRIALDDFGTGFASLTHLKQFPVDDIKIDQSFVRDLERDPDDAAIVSAVIGLGRSLGMQVVAEGVETVGQARYLLEHGCDCAQGYLYAKPMAGSRLPWFLREGTGVRADGDRRNAAAKRAG